MVHERIGLVIVGRDIKKIPLHELNKISSSYQNILDRSYLAYQKANRMTSLKRRNFYVTCEKLQPKHKSFSIDFLVHTESQLENTTILALIEGVLKLFKKIHRYGLKCEIKKNKEREITEVNKRGDEILVHPTLLKVSKEAQKSFHDLACCMKENQIKKITSYAPPNKKERVFLTYEYAKKLFPNINPEIRQEPVKKNTHVRITQFGVSRKGKLSIIKPGNLRGVKFKVGKNNYKKITNAMNNFRDNPDSYSKITGTKYILQKNGKDKIKCLYITDIINKKTT